VKKATMTMIAFVMMMAIALAGCSGNKNESSPSPAPAETNAPSGGSPAAEESGVAPNGEFPIVKDKITLKVLMKGNPDVEDFNTNDFTKWLEEKTNIHVEFSIADPKNWQQQLNLVLSGGDLPDVIMNLDVSPTQEMLYGSQGIIVPLQGLIDQYAPNLQKIFQDKPEIKPAITASDNNIYSLPRLNECFHCSMNRKMYVYQPWLEKLNLPAPETTDDFEKMLLAFKNDDPNGNGKKDEIPLAGAIDALPSQVSVFLMNAFIYDDSDKRLLLDNGKVDVAYNKPAWKDGLTYLNKLYAQGLIAPQSFTQDRASLKKMAENPDLPILGAGPAHSPSSLTVVEGPSNRWLEYQPIKPLQGPAGMRTSVYLPYDLIKSGQFMITKANKYPEATMRWADAFYSSEVTISANIGVVGKDWDWAKTGDKGRDGGQSIYTVINPISGTQNRTWDGLGLAYMSDEEYYNGRTVATQPDKEKMYYDVTKENYEPFKQSVDKIVPPLFFTKEQAAELAELETNISDYFKSMTAKFINGDAKLDKDWDGYLKTLQDMGLSRYIEIYQQAYDKKIGK